LDTIPINAVTFKEPSLRHYRREPFRSVAKTKRKAMEYDEP